jgi:DNA-binding PadR family transcriptional regulator
MVILMAISVGRGSGQKLLNRPMDVAGEYIGYLYDSLAKRGYLEGNSSRGYQLTPKGRESLLEFLQRNRTRVEETIRTLQQLGIESSQRMDKLVKEAIKVK